MPRKPRKRPLPYRPDDEIVRDANAPRVIGLSRQTVVRLRHAGQFVPEIRLGPNSLGYRRADLLQWLAQRTRSVKTR